MNEEQRIRVCKSGLKQIEDMLHDVPQDQQKLVTLAKTVTKQLDSTSFMLQPSRAEDQIRTLTNLQRVVSLDAGRGGLHDLAIWCYRQWLVIYQRNHQQVESLRSIGQYWLSRAQPLLARIYHGESSFRSSKCSQFSVSSLPTRFIDENTDPSKDTGGMDIFLTSAAEAELLLGTADYVEVRGYLHPAIEYLDKAVAAATEQGVLSGELLTIVGR